MRAVGGPRELGRAYGAAAAPEVHATLDLYERIFAHYTGLAWREVRDRAGAFAEPIDRYDIQLLPELEGIAEGAGVAAEDVLAVNVRTEIMFGLDARAATAARECTAFALSTGGAAPLVAQNWDWKPGARETCVVLVGDPHDRPAFLTLVEAGLWAKCGLNEAGIGLAFNALHSSLDLGEPGVPAHAILRRVLASTTFDQAVDAVRIGPRASSGNYVIASRDGRVADIEAVPGGASDVHLVEAGALAHANHFLWPAPRPFKDVGRIDGEDSVARQARAQAFLGAGASSIEDLKTALASHDDAPAPICVHDDPAVDPVEAYVTVAGIVADLRDATLHVTRGNPCEAPFSELHLATLLAEATSRT